MPYVCVGRLGPKMQSLGLVLMRRRSRRPAFSPGSSTQKSVRMTGIDWSFMIQPKLPIEKSAAPPSDVHLVVARVERAADGPLEVRAGGRPIAVGVSSTPLLVIVPTFCELRVEEAERRDLARAEQRGVDVAVVPRELRGQPVAEERRRRSRARPRSCAPDPRSGLPTLRGKNAGWPPQPTGVPTCARRRTRPARVPIGPTRRGTSSRESTSARSSRPTRPTRARLRVRLQPEVLAERAVAVDAKPDGEEIALSLIEQRLAEERRR